MMKTINLPLGTLTKIARILEADGKSSFKLAGDFSSDSVLQDSFLKDAQEYAQLAQLIREQL